MRATMAPPKKRKGGKHTSPREAFHMPKDLHEALLRFAGAADPPASKTAVMIAALKEYLQRRGALSGKPPAKADGEDA